MKLLFTLPAKLCLLMLGAVAAFACSGTEPEFVGEYVSADGRLSEMQISGEKGQLRIVLKGGASATDTDNTAADCEAIAEGDISDHVIHARLVPFEGELYSLDAADIEKMDSTVLITIDNGVAVVQGSFSHCALRNSLAGKYKRLKLRRR